MRKEKTFKIMFLQRQNCKYFWGMGEWKSLPEDELSASENSPIVKYLLFYH